MWDTPQIIRVSREKYNPHHGELMKSCMAWINTPKYEVSYSSFIRKLSQKFTATQEGTDVQVDVLLRCRGAATFEQLLHNNDNGPATAEILGCVTVTIHPTLPFVQMYGISGQAGTGSAAALLEYVAEYYPSIGKHYQLNAPMLAMAYIMGCHADLYIARGDGSKSPKVFAPLTVDSAYDNPLLTSFEWKAVRNPHVTDEQWKGLLYEPSVKNRHQLVHEAQEQTTKMIAWQLAMLDAGQEFIVSSYGRNAKTTPHVYSAKYTPPKTIYGPTYMGYESEDSDSEPEYDFEGKIIPQKSKKKPKLIRKKDVLEKIPESQKLRVENIQANETATKQFYEMNGVSVGSSGDFLILFDLRKVNINKNRRKIKDYQERVKKLGLFTDSEDGFVAYRLVNLPAMTPSGQMELEEALEKLEDVEWHQRYRKLAGLWTEIYNEKNRNGAGITVDGYAF